MFDLIASYLAWLYDLTSSYGLSVILLTLTVMIVVTPLTLSGTKSMMQMQRLQPEMKEIQAKYKDDRETLNQEMMAFYQENGINPVGGCLPLFVQAPVFYVLYRVVGGLTRRVTDVGASIGSVSIGQGDTLPTETFTFTHNFHPEYISESSSMSQDLSNNDEMKFLGVDLADSALDAIRDSFFHGFPYLLMIVIVLVTSLYQQKQIKGRASSTAAVNPQQEAIMKILPWFLPVISFTLQAALVVYFIVSNLYRIGQQSYITRTLYSDEHHVGAATSGGGAGKAAKSGTGTKKSAAKNTGTKNSAAGKKQTNKKTKDQSGSKRTTPPKSSNARRSSNGGRTTPKGSSTSNRQGPRREASVDPKPRKKKRK